MKTLRHRLSLLATSALAMTGGASLSACSESFDPQIEARDLYFSIGGYVDASADTQFVRVMPLRGTFFPKGDPIDAEVTMERLAGGQKVAWRDSIFHFGEKAVHNFWSTQPILPGERYRFEVRRSDGAVSLATISVPDTFSRPELCIGVDPKDQLDPPAIAIEGVERIAEIALLYDVYVDSDPVQRRTTHELLYTDRANFINFAQVVRLDVFRDFDQIVLERRARVDDIVVTGVSLRIAATEEDWPDAGLDLETLALPGVVTNIENGLGYLGAVTTQTIPWPELLAYLHLLGARIEGEPPPLPDETSELCGILLSP